MSEYAPEDDQDQAAAVGGQEFAPEAEQFRTGDEEVDGVLASVEDLDDRPVDEHVGVFENAHERLRRALDSSPDA